MVAVVAAVAVAVVAVVAAVATGLPRRVRAASLVVFLASPKAVGGKVPAVVLAGRAANPQPKQDKSPGVKAGAFLILAGADDP